MNTFSLKKIFSNLFKNILLNAPEDIQPRLKKINKMINEYDIPNNKTDEVCRFLELFYLEFPQLRNRTNADLLHQFSEKIQLKEEQSETIKKQKY